MEWLPRQVWIAPRRASIGVPAFTSSRHGFDRPGRQCDAARSEHALLERSRLFTNAPETQPIAIGALFLVNLWQLVAPHWILIALERLTRVTGACSRPSRAHEELQATRQDVERWLHLSERYPFALPRSRGLIRACGAQRKERVLGPAPARAQQIDRQTITVTTRAVAAWRGRATMLRTQNTA